MSANCQTPVKISCEKISVSVWSNIGSQKTCGMQSKTSISSSASELNLPADESMRGLMMKDNKKVLFLPINVYKSFPKLFVYAASNCSLNSVSRDNFKYLVELEALYLSHNQIEAILVNTFEDLTSLKWLIIWGNKVKFMNGDALQMLTELKQVQLSENLCIDDDFEDAEELATMTKSISEKCGFPEINHRIEISVNKLAEKTEQSEKKIQRTILEVHKHMTEMLELFISKTTAEKDNCLIKSTQLENEVAVRNQIIAEKDREIESLKKKIGGAV